MVQNSTEKICIGSEHHQWQGNHPEFFLLWATLISTSSSQDLLQEHQWLILELHCPGCWTSTVVYRWRVPTIKTHTRARLSCTGWKSTCNKPMYFICQGTSVWWGWVYECICFSIYLMGEEKEREGVRPTMKFSTPFHRKVGQTMLINWIWGARCSLQPWLLCSDRFCYLGWVNVSCINQCKGCILILEPLSGCVIGTRPIVLLGYLIKCEWQVTVRLPRGANLFGYSLFFFLIWLLCVKDGWRFRLVLYIHIFHQWLHTEEYNEIFVANL